MSEQDLEQLMLFPEDSPASHSPQPGSDEARTMTVTSGRKCCELYRKSGPLGSLVRTLLESSAWRSTRCYLIWKASATPARRLLFRLVPSTPRTEGTGLQSWPTPTASDTFTANLKSSQQKDGSRHSLNLSQAVKLWPTPKAQNARGAGQKHGKGGASLDVVVGGQLNPTWIEWLMGFPIGWTDLDASETQSSPNSSTQSSGQ